MTSWVRPTTARRRRLGFRWRDRMSKLRCEEARVWCVSGLSTICRGQYRHCPEQSPFIIIYTHLVSPHTITLNIPRLPRQRSHPQLASHRDKHIVIPHCESLLLEADLVVIWPFDQLPFPFLRRVIGERTKDGVLMQRRETARYWSCRHYSSARCCERCDVVVE